MNTDSADGAVTGTHSPAPGNANLECLRAQFSSLEHGYYFNHAAIAPWPARTAEAVKQFAAENVKQGPAGYANWIASETELREALARLTGATTPRDIALLKNTTECVSTVAWGMDWQAGDNVVLPLHEFASNRLPWIAQRARGVEVREIDIRAARNAEQALVDAMDRNTRLLAVSSVQWSDGFRLDLQALGDACRKRGVLFFVDAIQQLGALRIDVRKCHISFLAADAHKWLLGPEGIAVFYSEEEARSRLQLLQQGWHMFDNPWSFGREDWTPSASARRFEAGSPNSLGQVAFRASLELLLESGQAWVEQRVLGNTDRMCQHLQSMPDLTLLSCAEPARRSGIVTFRPQEVTAHALQRYLARHQVSCAVRDNAIRLSPHFYQGPDDVDEVFARIRKSLESS